MDRKTRREKERIKKGATMKSGMNKLMSLCLVAMMGTTFIPQPIQAEEVGKFEEESFEEATVEFEEGTFEEEKQNVEASPENSVTADFEYEGLKYKITDENKKEVEVIGFADGYQPTGYTLNIPNAVRKQVESDGGYTVTSIGDSAFKDCQYSSIKEILLPYNLRIGESAFEGFKSLVDINLYNCVNLEIGKSAFKDCTALDHLRLPKELKSIGESAFAGCTKLNDISFALNQYEEPSLMKLETIENSAFEGCTSLWDIDFSELQHLTTIGESAFAGCTKLGRIELPEGLTTIGDLAFALGESTSEETSPHLSFINIPSSVKTLGSIFGDKSPFGKRYEYSFDPLLFFQGDLYPEMKEGFLRVISEGKNKPTICFPNTETAIDAYAGKNSPFVKVGLIDATHFDPNNEQKYETIQVCPGKTTTLPLEDYFGKLKVTSDNPDVAFVTQDYAAITGKSIGKAIITYTYEINGIEVVSDKFDQFKVTVDHKYVWMCEDLPSKDQPGSMFQYCLLCHDQKPSISFPDYPMNPDLPEETPSIIIGAVQDGNFESVATVESDDQPFELVALPLKDGNINLQNYSCKVESSDSNIATVNINEKGNILVTPVNEGIAIITATYTKEKESLVSSNENSFVNESGSDNELKATFVVEVVDSKDDIPTGGGSGGGSTGGGSGGGSTGGSTSGGSSTGGGSTIDPNAPTPQVENAVYRAYNSSNGEHLYTTNYEEFKVITKNGWDDEGIAFMSELKEKGQAVYRVYNPNSGLHHYTTDVNEKNALVSLGWNDEGVAFYTSKNPKDTPVYRVYNENDGNHHYTMNANEALALISMGWKNEGIAFLTAPMK